MSGKTGHLPMLPPKAVDSSVVGAGSERVAERLVKAVERRVEYFSLGCAGVRNDSSFYVGSRALVSGCFCCVGLREGERLYVEGFDEGATVIFERVGGREAGAEGLEFGVDAG